ncbi:MAG: family 10 glycosylhydrolase [Acidobacteria bacterium]|nr:family 10 glycosylhydrolase [Acidobacteriota bacterium]
MKPSLLVCLLVLVLTATQAIGQPQYRAVWVDTFNTSINNTNDVRNIIKNIESSNCNAIFVQVRRRGDSWYLNSLEPPADRTPLEPGFDPLKTLIREAHAKGIEVHAFVIIGAIWNGNPAGPTARLPENPNHLFNKHGFNQATGKMFTGRDNWMTRSLLPDDNYISYGGYRIGQEFWVDLGHPDAADYSYYVLSHLVRNYDIDGLHLDRIRYPELYIAGQSSATGANIGYNETSLARYQKRYNIPPGTPPPAPNDPRWSDWRRDQVTNFVRRVYLNTIAIKPRLIVSAALIAFGSGPNSEADWNNADCYWRVYQDWRSWTEEGILDYAIPMNYRRDHLASQSNTFDDWMEWAKNHQYNRSVLIGTGAFINSLEGTLRQVRRVFAPSTQGKRAGGVVLFSYASNNDAITSNSLALPPGQNTPRRSIADLISGLTFGISADGRQPFEELSTNTSAVFAQPAPIPKLQGKTSPMVGHLKGIVRRRNGDVVDSGDVYITRTDDSGPTLKGRTSISTRTDGSGFYGGVDLAPGNYRVSVVPVGEPVFASACNIRVVAGKVATFDILIDPSAFASGSTANCGPSIPLESIIAAVGSAGGAVTSSSIQPASTTAQVGPPIETPVVINENAKTGPNGNGLVGSVVMAIKSNGTQGYEPVLHFDEIQNRFVARPIDLGQESDQVFLILYCTGGRLSGSGTKVSVKIAGQEAEVLYAGNSPEFEGLDQLSVRLSRSLIGRGMVDVVWTINGYGVNRAQINIK